MSVKESTEQPVVADQTKSPKRKRTDDAEELEIDLNAAEPPSKKALRKAKRQKSTQSEQPSEEHTLKNTSSTRRDEARETKSTSTGRSPYGIWIGNLSYTTTKDDLMNFITSDTDFPISKDCVTRIHLPSGPIKAGKPQNKGFAYIDFTDAKTLSQSLKLSEKLFGGRRVLIKDAKNFEGRPSNTSKEDIASGKPPSRRIFIGNLTFDTTSEDLERHFGVCGTISKVQVAQFEDSGKCKGYAWVEFDQLSSAQAAMRGWVEQGQTDTLKQSKRRIWLHKLDGRKLRMEFAEDPTTRYNKRFGKDSKNAQNDEHQGADITADGVKLGEVEDEQPARTKRQPHPRKEKQLGPYDEQTVRRLQGAITEGQGKKVVFD
ncbi:Nucleolar protein 13 [Neophaeococcomyces mojaviensis]|uniref:Nucleolar protein 13 n=1 Tax=Neophaeococcomyces mojaviensis TaxID=3383035 RepID=A0ACC2ZYP5_9EURO|nr:Nucleolar protein 13 [Knufia sp. JES_112]